MRLTGKVRRIVTLGTLLFVMLWNLANAQYRVVDIPSPKQQGQGFFVSNPDGILSSYAVDSLNAIAREIEANTTAEMAIVAVDAFDGDDDFEFALELFQTWGIGKQENDNGLLLFIATQSRAYRFITGYGMEAALPDALLKRIGEQYLVPEFKQGNYDESTLATVSAIRDILLDPQKAAELKAEMRKQSFFYRYQDVGIYSLVIILLTFATLKWMGYIIQKKIVVGRRKRTKYKGQNGLAAVGGCGCLVLILF